MVKKLIGDANDVRDLYEQSGNLQKWSPNMLMLVAGEGFNIDAINWANDYNIYCVYAKPNGFDFVGKMAKQNFENKEYSLI